MQTLYTTHAAQTREGAEMTLALQLIVAIVLVLLPFLLYGAVVAHWSGKRSREKARESMYKIGSK